MPDDILYLLVQYQLNTAGCMNKGFILDGYPRTENDAKNIFQVKVEHPVPAGSPEGTQPQVEFKINEKIVPQFAIHFEAEDKYLVDRAKELPSSVVEGTHWND